MTGIATTATAARTGAGLNGSDATRIAAGSEHRQKPLKSSGFLPFWRSAKARENSVQLAGHPKVPLLNDALLQRACRIKFRAHSSVGRAADS
jgi:hypothetical protein